MMHSLPLIGTISIGQTEIKINDQEVDENDQNKNPSTQELLKSLD